MNYGYLNCWRRHRALYLPLIAGAIVMTSAVGTASAPGIDVGSPALTRVQFAKNNVDTTTALDRDVLNLTIPYLAK